MPSNIYFHDTQQRKTSKTTNPSPATKKWHLSLIAFKGSTSQYLAFAISATVMRSLSFFPDKCTIVSGEIFVHDWSKFMCFPSPTSYMLTSFTFPSLNWGYILWISSRMVATFGRVLNFDWLFLKLTQFYLQTSGRISLLIGVQIGLTIVKEACLIHCARIESDLITLSLIWESTMIMMCSIRVIG